MNITFRGFRKDGKGQLIGDLNHIDGKVYVFPRDGSSVDSYDAYEIHPESLGMAVGLQDKNGKQIFGSIDGNNGGSVMFMFGQNIPIYFHLGAMGYFTSKGTPHQDFHAIGTHSSITIVGNKLVDYEIIGNQYEQPQQ